MKSRSNELVDRATAAMVAAIEIYNKPSFSYRAESFAILAINSWELLLKAKWLADHGNKAQSLFIYERRENAAGSKSEKQYIKRTRTGNPFTHSIEHLAKKLVESKDLDLRAWENIQILLELRDSAMHFYNQSPAFRVRLQEIGAACLKNFTTILKEWFNRELSEFNLYLMPLAFVDLHSHKEGLLLNAEEKNFLSFVETLEETHHNPNSPYSVTVNIDMKFIRSKAKDALAVQLTNDPNAPKVHLTDEQIREKYPWDYQQLTEHCRNRYSNFKSDNKYHRIRKNLLSDTRHGAIRFLDPGNPRSAKKPFFNPNIIIEFDKHYRIRKK